MSIQSLPTSYNVTIQPASQQTQGTNTSDITNVLQSLMAFLSTLMASLNKMQQQSPFEANPASSGVGNALPQTPLAGTQQPAGTTQPAAGSTTPQAMDAHQACGLLNSNFDNIKGKDGMVGRKELEKAVSDPNTSPQMKAAAQFLLDNKSAFRELDRADSRSMREGPFGEGHRSDNRISRGDTNAAMQKAPMTEEELDIATTLLRNKSSVLSGDGLLSREELGKIATGTLPNGKTASPELQSAAQTLLAKPEMFNKLADGYMVDNPNAKVGERGDDKLGLDDLLTALKR